MGTPAISRREERRQQQHVLSRNQLLDAAEEIFGTKGFHEATLREVAELAEFSVGSVYSFFTNKDDLFLHVFIRRGDEFLEGIRDVAGTDDPPLEKLRRLVAYEVGFFRAHPNFGRLYLRTATLARPLPGDGDAGGLSNFQEVMALRTSVIEAGQRAGVVRPGDATALLGLLSGIVTAFVAVDPTVITGGVEMGERLPLAELADMVVAAFGTAPGGADG